MLPPDLKARFDALPFAIEPLYRAQDDARTVLLYRGPAEWRSQSVRTNLDEVLVYLDLLPSPHLLVDGRVSAAEAFGDWFSSGHTVRLPRMASVPPPPTEGLAELAVHEGEVSQVGPSTGFSVGTLRKVAHVDFIVLNYPDIAGEVVRYPSNAGQTGRLRFSGGGWRVTLDPVEDLGEVLNHLRRDGGVSITHAGRLEREDGALLSATSALEVLECLHYFLWFTKGASCAPLLATGVSRSGSHVWSHWNAPWVSSYRASYSWVDHAYGRDQIATLFPLFLVLWRNATYNLALRVAIRYYLDANDANPVNRGIALAQLSLEALAYAHLVTAGNDPGAVGIRIRANVTLRRLLELLRVPRAIPASMSALRAARPTYWTTDPWDGPSALTWLRNEVLHGRPSVPPPTWRAWVQGWKLSCWYVELCLLSLTAYRGACRSRVHGDSWTGSVRRVPWAR